MMIKQYIKGGFAATLGEEGAKRKYNPKDLSKDFSINFRFYNISSEQEIANTAIAQQQKALDISTHTIYRDTLHLQDPEGEIMKGDSERVARENLFIRRFRDGLSLIKQADKMDDEAKRIEVKAILGELKVIWANMGGGEVGGETKKPSQPKAMVDLFGGGGGGAVQGEEERLPEELLNREDRRAETIKKNVEEG